MQRNRFIILLMILLFGTLVIAAKPIRAIDYYLTLDTSPSEVLTIDPEAVTGEGYYASGSFVLIEAKQTVETETVRYEFVAWSHNDINGWYDPDEDPPVLTETQALIFMDADRTVTAIYEPHYYFYLTLDTSPSEVLTIDPEAVTGEGYYASGSWVTIDAKQTIISGATRYEFVGWSTTDTAYADPDDVAELTGNQALLFMDGNRFVTAIYEEQFVGTWENSFESASGFALRISTNDKYFQFITPEKTYSITEADSMMLIGRTTIIFHSDDKLTLVSFSNSNIDYCLTYAQDMQTGQRYVLIDRIGFE
jgi:hypothetical protein